MRQLRGNLNPAVAERRQRPLPLQRLRPLLQDERPEQAPRQAQAAIGEFQATALAAGLPCMSVVFTLWFRSPYMDMSFIYMINSARTICTLCRVYHVYYCHNMPIQWCYVLGKPLT